MNQAVKILRVLIFSALIIGLAVRCSSDPKAKITALEKEMSSEKFMLDEKGMQKADELVKAYIDYSDAHDDSPEAPQYLYKAADLSLNINKSRQALDLYNKIIYQYPDFKKVPECLFLMGYIYENYFQELGRAKEIYESFLQKYPEHDFADDARISIDNLGKSPEELIREFEAKNRAKQDTVI